MNVTEIEKYKIAIKFSYDGKNYSGLALQKKEKNTIAEQLILALKRLRIYCDDDPVFAGRTDKGVSAKQMVASFLVTKPPSKKKNLDKESFEQNINDKKDNKNKIIPLESTSHNTNHPNYGNMINSALPFDICISFWAIVPNDFSARYNCIERHYKYFFFINDYDIQNDGNFSELNNYNTKHSKITNDLKFKKDINCKVSICSKKINCFLDQNSKLYEVTNEKENLNNEEYDDQKFITYGTKDVKSTIENNENRKKSLNFEMLSDCLSKKLKSHLIQNKVIDLNLLEMNNGNKLEDLYLFNDIPIDVKEAENIKIQKLISEKTKLTSDLDKIFNKMIICAKKIKELTYFRRFCKRSEERSKRKKEEEIKDSYYKRTINELEIFRVNTIIDDEYFVLDIKAQSFLHNMVRKIFFVIYNYGIGKISNFELDQILKNEIDFGTGPAKNLVFCCASYLQEIKWIESTKKYKNNYEDVRLGYVIEKFKNSK